MATPSILTKQVHRLDVAAEMTSFNTFTIRSTSPRSGLIAVIPMWLYERVVRSMSKGRVIITCESESSAPYADVVIYRWKRLSKYDGWRIMRRLRDHIPFLVPKPPATTTPFCRKAGKSSEDFTPSGHQSYPGENATQRERHEFLR